jgi:hypothetical protein
VGTGVDENEVGQECIRTKYSFRTGEGQKGDVGQEWGGGVITIHGSREK